MKRLINTTLFDLLEKMDTAFEPNQHDLKLAYDKFIQKVTCLCTSQRGDIPVYFTIQYTYLELQQLQTFLNKESLKKKTLILEYITLSLSFLTVALEWMEHHPAPVTENRQSEPPSGCYIWEGTISDLIELATAIHNIKLIRKPSGELLTFSELVHALKLIFDIKIPKNIYSRKARALERKKNPSSFLERMLAVYNHEIDKRYK